MNRYRYTRRELADAIKALIAARPGRWSNATIALACCFSQFIARDELESFLERLQLATPRAKVFSLLVDNVDDHIYDIQCDEADEAG